MTKDNESYQEKREQGVKQRTEMLIKKYDVEQKANKEKLKTQLEILKTNHERSVYL